MQERNLCLRISISNSTSYPKGHPENCDRCLEWFYHGVPLEESDRHLTTFITPYGRWRYLRAPQWFVSSGDGYNRRYDAVLSDFIDKELCVEDLCHYDGDLENHWWRAIDLLITLGKAGVMLNPEKFQFAEKAIGFSGFHVSESSIEPLPKYLDAIQDFPSPKNICDYIPGLALSIRCLIMLN